MINLTTPQTTRIAPSPTGNAHIGLVRTAYLNYLAARASGGEFILRIDDTDKERSKPEYTENIVKTLEWLGLDFDTMVFQSERFGRYEEVAAYLLEHGLARVQDGALYFNPKHWTETWEDAVAGPMAVTDKDKELTQNLVLMRKDGSPTYHFASCVDDYDMGITLIIRGTDHLTNTSKHAQLFHTLGATPKFAHVGLIFHNGKKISKRDGLADMEYYKEKYTPEAILNAVLKLGWGHPNANLDKEHPLIDRETAFKLFPEGTLKAAKSTLDLNKLEWLNKKYGQRTAKVNHA